MLKLSLRAASPVSPRISRAWFREPPREGRSAAASRYAPPQSGCVQWPGAGGALKSPSLQRTTCLTWAAARRSVHARRTKGCREAQSGERLGGPFNSPDGFETCRRYVQATLRETHLVFECSLTRDHIGTRRRQP